MMHPKLFRRRFAHASYHNHGRLAHRNSNIGFLNLRKFAMRSTGFISITAIFTLSAKGLTRAKYHGVNLDGLLVAAGDLGAIEY
jgi:hypothetical protein